MLRVLTALFACAVAHAATSSATLQVNVTLTTTASGYTASGTATLTGGIAASGTFSATLSSTALFSGGPNPYTISTSSGSLGGSLTIPTGVLTAILGGSTSASGASATITSATGSYAGDTGTFPNLSGSGGVGASGITIAFQGSGTVTTGGTVTAPPPTISAVLDAASNTANLAQGTIFIVKGSALCSVTSLTAYSVPRPTTGSDGVTITFTPAAGGSSTNALIWYEDPLGGGACQLAGILPSSVAPGNYNVTVTNGTASAPVAATVVAHKFALFTQDSTGTGLAVAQNVVSATEYDLNRLTTGSINGIPISPAYPGEYMVAYGTGLGGVTGDDNIASPVYDFTKNGVTVQAVVGGMNIPVLFAGRAGYAGEDQINFQLPSNVPTGCTITFQISVNGTLSPATTISIAPSASAGACVYPGLTTAQLQGLDSGGTITSGGFSISSIAESIASLGNIKIDSIGGGFTQISGFQLSGLSSVPGYSFTTTTNGACSVTQVTISGGGQTTTAAPVTVTNLDAGAVTVSGPTGSSLNNTPLTESLNSYSLSIGEEGITIPGALNGAIVAGKYTVAGAGGKDVKAFSASITLGSPLTLAAPVPATIVRANGLPLTWTGGNATDPVLIVGYSGSSSGTGANIVITATEFLCQTTAGTGGFTVPPSVLNQLQATAATSLGGSGFIEVASGPAPVAFSAGLTAGGTVASTFSALQALGALVTYQ